MKEKSDAITYFKKFKVTLEKEANILIPVFHTDRGGEFTSQDLNILCEEHMMIRYLTSPYMLQQNNKVERQNCTLLETTRGILKAKKVPNYL